MKIQEESVNSADIWEEEEKSRKKAKQSAEKEKEKLDFSVIFDRVLMKDSLRSVKNSLSRFISIVAIVALGISFFAGMNATAPDMTASAQQYYSDTNLMDICVQSTIGLSASDIDAISAINGVECVMPVRTVDGLLSVNGEHISDIDGSTYTVRVMSLDINKAYANAQYGENLPEYMNRVTLLEGNWPTATNECLVDASRLSTPDEFVIGNTVKIEADKSDFSSKLNTTEYKIVGIIRSPLYISYERGYTNVGTGKLGAFIYVPQECFVLDYYTAAYVKIAGSGNFKAYTKEYESFIEPYKAAIEELSKTQIHVRSEALYNRYSKDVADGKAEYEKKKAEAESQLADAKKEVENIKYLASYGDELVKKLKEKYNESAVSTDNQLGMAELERTTQYAKWEENTKKYNEVKALVDQYADAETNYNNALTTYNITKNTVATSMTTVTSLEQAVAAGRSAIDQLNVSQDDSKSEIIERIKSVAYDSEEIMSIVADIKSLTAVGTAEEIAAYMEPELQSLEVKLTAAKAALTLANNTLASKEQELKQAEQLVLKLKELKLALSQAEKELSDAKKELDDAEYQIQFSQQDAVNQLLELKTQISNYEIQIPLAKEKVNTVDAEYEAKAKEIYSLLDTAKYKLDEGEALLSSLPSASWVIDTRDGAVKGYTEYYNTANRTSALSKALPWFFFLVAAMVSLNTMTRMVEEDRTQIGTLKALGFRDVQILMKYIIYAAVASLVGCVIGTLIGFWVFPSVICRAFGILFDMPPVILTYRVGYAVTGTIIATGATVLATYLALKNIFEEVPSNLMRPKAPEAGGRIFLENMPRIWSRLNFSSKVTCRNVFRNKKRFIMVIAGVAGCTALLVAGLGLGDSIKTTIANQFEGENSICRYDVQIALKNTFDSSGSGSEIYSTVSNKQAVARTADGGALAMFTSMKTGVATSDNSNASMEINIVVPDKPESLNRYINLTPTKKGSTISNNGCVITDKLADKLNLSVGDRISLEKDGASASAVVTGIVRNYAFHYVYILPDAYESIFGEGASYNFITACLKDGITGEEKTAFATELMNLNDVSAVAFTSNTIESLSYILDSLNYVVIVIVAAAALLALTVLYNLSNININERYKEIATLKVLGFNKNEVSAYISRENLILAVIGMLIGLVAGIPLHRLVIVLAEVDVVRFGRTISPLSFLYAAVLSLAFTVIVNLIMRIRLKKIDMVESLKSVE